MDRAGFDPRYSPEFQRGFDPAVHEEIAAPTEQHEHVQPRPITPVPEPIMRRIPPAPVDAAEGSEQSATAGADDMFRPAESPDQERSDEEAAPVVPASPWRNPYLVALSVAGLVLIAGGIGGFRWSLKQVFSGAVYGSGASEGGMPEAMIAAQLAWGLSPLLALAGVLTLLGVFFFVAWRWSPQRRFVDDDSGAAPPGNQSD
jgi:hypothetical protein